MKSNGDRNKKYAYIDFAFVSNYYMDRYLGNNIVRNLKNG